MADKKISALTELTTPADGDKIPIVDVSDTTQAASGTTKFIQKLNLITGSGGGVWSLLETVTCDSQAYIDFNGDDGSTYDNMTDSDFIAFKIEMVNVRPSQDTSYNIRFIDNGSPITAAVYKSRQRVLWNTTTQDVLDSTGAQSYISQKIIESTSGFPGFTGTIHLPLLDGTIYPHFFIDGIISNSTLMARIIGGGAIHSAYSTIEGVRLYTTAGTFASGTIKLFGLAI